MVIEVAQKAVKRAIKEGAYQAEATVAVIDNALTRYTKNAIHQNVAQIKLLLNLEVVVDKHKKGSTSINSLDDNAIKTAVDRAMGIARVSAPDSEWITFPELLPYRPLPETYNKRTVGISADDMADGVQTLIETALDHDKRVQWSTGAYTREIVDFAIANSQGVNASTKYTRGSVDITTKAGDNEDGSGFKAAHSHDVGLFDLDSMARSAATDAVKGIAPQLIPLGEYEAVLTPTCVSTFTGFMGRLGFNAKAYQDGYSCLTDKFGADVFDEKLTIYDDGRSLETFNAAPFDGEGIPKRKLSLVNKGVPENLCYDTYTALKDDTESTGHSLPKHASMWFRGVPLPVNMVMKTGDASVEEMVADTKKGVLLSRLHYVNAIRNDLAIISGLTRDACWLIENGEIKHPIKVMRFTDSVLDVMNNIDIIGNRSTVEAQAMATIPAIKVAKLKFTGQSEF
jgi:PmbA protein